MTNLNPIELTESDKVEYVLAFWESIEPLIIKQRLNKRLRKTRFKITNGSSKNKYGVKRHIILTHGKAEIEFTIEVIPWEWREGTLYVEIAPHRTNNHVLIPKRKIKPPTKGAIWKPGFDILTFLKNTEAIGNYLTYVELSWTDLGLFDTIEAAVKSIIER